MLFAALLLASSGAAVIPAEDPALLACTAHAARIDAFRDIPTEALAADETFLDKVEGRWCADEVTGYWRAAHDQARIALGLPEGGSYNSEKQRLAEANMRRMLSEAWAVAAPMRADPPPLSASRRDKFRLIWTLENLSEESPVGLAVKPVVTCLAPRLRADPRRVRALGEAMGGGAPVDLAPHADECGYSEGVTTVAAMMGASLPGDPQSTYETSASRMIQMLLFYATIAQPK